MICSGRAVLERLRLLVSYETAVSVSKSDKHDKSKSKKPANATAAYRITTSETMETC